MRLALLLPALLPLIAAPASAAFSSAARGTSSASFLRLAVGARPAALGEAYSALADDASALFWNPAALTRVPRRSATFMHAAYLDSSFFDYGAYAQNLGKWGALGLGGQYFSAGSMKETDTTGTEVGDFTPHDLAASVGYARIFAAPELPCLDGIAAGVAVKYIRSTILKTAQTAAFDVGLLSPAYFDDHVRLAASAANLGGSLRYEQESAALPLIVRLGSAYQTNRYSASLEAGLPRDNAPFAAIGSEYLLVQKPVGLALRAGFNSRTVGDIDGFSGASFGLGFLHAGAALDYALVPFGGLGLAHRVSLSFAF